ncbi:PEP-CTERM sorting domain-containing protein [Nitrosospira briensis]|uniref:PEP-CTERM sorting domain-containing protein n=1 Tax=Nitrosospira briensis TaxID=35799 RepID=UPI00046807B3|nr:PEP-CTERM sorting domain-containing protein [Nitrosospira briensis]
MTLSKSLVATALIVFASASHANTVIKFDAVIGHPNGVAVPDGYYGSAWLGWTNFHLIEVTNPSWSNSGAVQASVSLPGVANTDSGLPSQIYSIAPFTLNSAYFAADWNDGLEVNVRGLSEGLIIHSKSFTIDTQHPTLMTFDWEHVDTLLFSARGGIPNSTFSGTGTGFAMDNLIINGPVSITPEPETYAMLLAGLGLLGWRMRSVRN